MSLSIVHSDSSKAFEVRDVSRTEVHVILYLSSGEIICLTRNTGNKVRLHLNVVVNTRQVKNI